MKKIHASIILVILFLALWGCGLQDKSQYNEETNQEVSYGINFQIPGAWKKTYEDEWYLEYAELEANGNYKNCLAITFNQEIKLKERIAEIKYGLGISAKQYGNIDNIRQSSISIANMPAEKIEYEQKLGLKEGKANITLVQTVRGVIEISFYSPYEKSHNDFAKILESITVKKQ